MKMKFPEDLMQQAQAAQTAQDKRFDVLLQLVEYLFDEHSIDLDERGEDHSDHIMYAAACVHEWHNEILARLALTENDDT